MTTDRSVSGALRRIVMLTTTCTLLVACAAFAAADFITSRHAIEANLDMLADVIGTSTATSLMFSDHETARVLLSALRAKPSIVAVSIYTAAGTPFADYSTDGGARPWSAPPIGSRYRGKYVEVVRDIVFDGEIIGRVYLVDDMRGLINRMKRYAVVALLVLLASLLLALILSSRLQRTVTRPILNLATIADRVRRDRDYSLRAQEQPQHTANEIELLTSAFNDMLAEIQQRDGELQLHRDDLEATIESRTAELRVVADQNERLGLHKQRILNTVAEGLFELDARGAVTFINRSAASMLGYGEEELIGKPLHAILHADDRSAALEECDVCSSGNRRLRAGRNVLFTSRGGNPFRVEFTANAMPAQSGAAGVVVTFRDITERLAVERLKDEFVSTVSHELRTPLTSIRGALGLLLSGHIGSFSQRASRMLDIALTNTDRLVRLINDILDLEKLTSSGVDLHRQSVAASILMRDAIDVVQHLADKADITIVSDSDETSLWVDPDRLVQTLTNLLGNAIKFSPEGTTVRLTGKEEDGSFVFRVADQGRGIPAEKLESIFERFKQVDASDSRDKGGSGLGLSICRSIVSAHEGRIWAESRVGEGSTFIFTLPLPTAAVTRDEATPIPRPVVLVHAEEAHAATQMIERVHGYGYNAVLVADVADLLPLAYERQALAVIVDVSTQQGAGAEEIHAVIRRCSVPVIVATNDPSQFGRVEGAVAGWIHKPYAAEDVAAALAAASGAHPVFVVEDDPDLARVIHASLESRGLMTIGAASGAEALKICGMVVPALLILDVGLPDIDGFTIIEWMRSKSALRQVPVLVYSASELSISEQQRLRLGPTIFLTKSRTPQSVLVQRAMSLLRAEPIAEIAGAA